MAQRQYENDFRAAGNLASSLEVRYMPNRTPVGNARLAINNVYDHPEKGTQTHTTWLTLVFLGEPLVEVAKRYQKGQNIYVKGAVETRTINSNGRKRVVTEVIVRKSFAIATGSEGGNQIQEQEHVNENDEADSAYHPYDRDDWPAY
jgi:single stranded DNA-binding protein